MTPNSTTCAVPMANLKPCGRPVHHAPADIDQTSVCLMHSSDAGKDADLFTREVVGILNSSSAEMPTLDFTRFVFPVAQFLRRVFDRSCVFEHARFWTFPTFATCEFRAMARFSGAVFEKGAIFQQSRFNQRADFSGCVFLAHADFVHVVFGSDALFSGSIFREGVLGDLPPQGGNFTESIFAGNAKFNLSEFKGTAQFGGCGFNADADFSGCDLEQAQFSLTSFARDANFSRALIHDSAYFRNAQFLGFANLNDMRVRGNSRQTTPSRAPRSFSASPWPKIPPALTLAIGGISPPGARPITGWIFPPCPKPWPFI
jgi:uncharacterized protein YjbI with pentapeptide repeats